MTSEQQEIFEERAAICEYHGGLTSEKAVEIARKEVIKKEQEQKKQGELEL